MRSLLLAPLSLAAILSLTSGTVLRRSNPAQASTQDVKVIEVSAKKYEYNPSSIHVKQGTKVQLRITATDHTHGFKIGAFSDGSDQNGSPGLAFTSPQDCWIRWIESMRSPRGRLPCEWSRQEPWQRSRRPARGRGFWEMVLEGVRAFGAHRYSRCRLRASSLALDQDQIEAEEHL